jgi:leucyl aminopeptidase
MNYKLSSAKAEDATTAVVTVGNATAKIKRGSTLERLDKKMKGHIGRILKQAAVKGKSGEANLIHSQGRLPCDAILILGSAYEAKGDLAPNRLELLRQAAARAARIANQRKYKSLSFDLSSWHHKDSKEVDQLEAIVEGMELGLYRFAPYKDTKEDKQTLTTVNILGASSSAANRHGLERGRAIAEGTQLARDLVNTPAGDMTPTRMGREAKKIAKGIQIRVYNRQEIAKMKMGAFLAVASGSTEAPALIHMCYRPKTKTKKSIAVVGKGVTFDSGGLSLKPATGMETMKDDMAGAAAAIGLMKTLSVLKPKCTVHVVVAATENMPSGSAVKPGDIARSMSGKTIEILNTDAEGRLTLADALHFVLQKKPNLVIDVATLTGACLVALGERCAAVMGNDQKLLKGLKAASQHSGERLWPLPLIEEYAAENKSPIADIKNVGGRWGGTINAGLFLREFVGDARWAHIDIAGSSWTDKELPYATKGGTGSMVSTLTRFILDY